MNMQVLDARRDVSGGYKVDVSRGERVGRVSSEWFSRPDDERYLSLGDLARSVRGRSEHSRTRVVETALIHVEANRNDPERLSLILPGADAPVAPTHWSFGQLASQVGAPAAYLRQLPAPLAAINLQYGLTSHRAEQIKTLETDNGRVELRAVTGPDYGRIYDHELVEAVQKIAGNGTGDTRWKVPGVLDWSTGIYNPRVDITRDTTTLYASDRDVFLFLVDDLNPIEAGRLPDGSPDLYFRGFYCWNSEVGAKTLGMASFYLRAVCQNRNLWGVEDFEEITIRHSKYAANRFAHEAAPALEGFANSSPLSFATNDERTAKRVSDALGTATEMKAMRNYAGHRLSPWLGHLMVSRSETARPLLTPGEIMQLPPADEIVMVAGIPPIKAKKARYYEDARFKERILPPPALAAPTKVQADDWTGLALPPQIASVPASPLANGDDDDTTDSERRQQPELSLTQPIENRQPVQNEFDLDGDHTDEDDDLGARNQRLTGIMQGVARQASLDFDDGMEI